MGEGGEMAVVVLQGAAGGQKLNPEEILGFPPLRIGQPARGGFAIEP